MSFSYSSIIDEALRVANLVGSDGNASPVIDNSVVLEDLFYSALKKAIVEGSESSAEVGGLKYDHTITITDGKGTIPDSILNDFLDDSALYTDDGSLNGLMSFQPRYFDYVREGHSQLGYYTVQDNKLLVKEPGGDINAYDGTVHLVTTTVPTVVDATTALNISTETAKRTIEFLAQMLRGVQTA